MLNRFTFLAICTLAGAYQAQARVIQGKVTDQVSGGPLSGVTVTVGGKTGVTDVAGHYLIVRVGKAAKNIKVTLANYTSQTRAIPPNVNLPGQDFSLLGKTRVLPVTALAARRDTRLLCLDGCSRKRVNANSSVWDRSRSGEADVSDHDVNYCAMAAVKMINRYYGGTITRDEIGFHIAEANGLGAPEEDLRHNLGTMPDDTRDALSWSLGGAAITTVNILPTDLEIAQYINSNRPMAWGVIWDGGTAHRMVVSGYRYVNKQFQLRYLDTDNNSGTVWAPKDFPGSTFRDAYIPPSKTNHPKIGIKTDPLIAKDSDGDGVSDFDEIRRWRAAYDLDPNKADTDADGLPDKKDIEGWLFRGHATDAQGQGQFDEDGDGLRAEVDPDSDNGGVYDGDEDLNHDANRTAGETNPYTAVKPNADDIPKVKIQVTSGKVIDGKRYVKGTVNATFTFYRKDGSTALRINPNTSPLLIQYRPKGGALTTVAFVPVGTLPTTSCTCTFALPNNTPAGKATFSLKNGSQPITIVEGKEFFVDLKGGVKKWGANACPNRKKRPRSGAPFLFTNSHVDQPWMMRPAA